jgi:hypothetical protein
MGGIKAIVKKKIGKNLTHLWYDGCLQCTDAALESIIRYCPNLKILFASHSAGISKIPQSIGKCLLPHLKRLDLLGHKGMIHVRPELFGTGISIVQDLSRRDSPPMMYYVPEESSSHPPKILQFRPIVPICNKNGKDERKGTSKMKRNDADDFSVVSVPAYQMLKGDGKYAEFLSLQGDSRHKVDKDINVTEHLLSKKMGRPFSMDTSMYRQALAEVRVVVVTPIALIADY